MERKRKPNWWLLYLTVPLMIVLLVLEARMPYPLVVHRIAEFAIVLVSFGLMAVWMRANQGALVDEGMVKERWALPDPKSEDGSDSGAPPCAREGDGSEESPYQMEAGPTKGRYN